MKWSGERGMGSITLQSSARVHFWAGGISVMVQRLTCVCRQICSSKGTMPPDIKGQFLCTCMQSSCVAILYMIL